jgi:ABC-type Zn uptake system ZnuABC Zn-binding protein ZnuA
VNAVAEDVGREVRIVEILTGSLAQAGSRGDSYLDFIRYNTEQIVSGLSR